LFEGGFEIFDDVVGENIGIREVVTFFEAFVTEPEDVETSLVAIDQFFVIVGGGENVRSPFSHSHDGLWL